MTREQALLHHALGEELVRLLEDPTTVEICINGNGSVWHEAQAGALAETGLRWTAAQTQHLMAIVAGITGQVCTPDHPSLSAVLPGSRVRFQGKIPPATSGPNCTMRRPPDVIYPLSAYMAAWQEVHLRHAVARAENIIVAGKTQSGKTSLSNSLIALMSGRICTLEDTKETQIRHNNTVDALTTPGRDMQVLLREVLRERPDRVIVTECRGAEFATLLDTWMTGHPGGVCTIHADTPATALLRMESMMAQAQVAREEARSIIAQVVHWVVCMAKTDHGRRVTALARMHGLSPAKDAYAYTLVTEEQAG